MNESVLKDFCTFATAQLKSKDIDPSYPVLKRLYDLEALPTEWRYWRTLLYTTFYHLGSAERVWQRVPEPRLLKIEEVTGLPTGTERRAFRGKPQSILAHVNTVLVRANSVGGLGRYWRGLAGAWRDPKLGWQAVRADFKGYRFGGPWSSYKWADLLKHVHDLPITANDIGVGGGGATAGPVPGMVRVTGSTWERCAADVQLQQHLHDLCVVLGVPFNGLDQLETALCDFNSLCKGAYYLGHDVDDQMDKLAGCSQLFWQARREVFEPRYLGELSGWSGVRKQLKGAYAERGELVNL